VARKSAPILVLQHHPDLPLGTLHEPLASEGSELHVYHHGHHEPPDPELADAFGAIVSLGGLQSANDAATDPFLARELRLLEVAVREDVPVLGICLGAQMLARALGAAVRANVRGFEAGWGKVSLTPRAKADSLLKGWSATETVFHYHGESFDLPRDARLLLTGEKCERQAFAHGGSRLGFQFHIEADARAADSWAGTPEAARDLAAAGTTLLQISNDSLVHAKRQVALAHAVGRRFALMAKGLRPDQSGPVRV
jgi:GMP synthase (glutamine-hydrolysing)